MSASSDKNLIYRPASNYYSYHRDLRPVGNFYHLIVVILACAQYLNHIQRSALRVRKILRKDSKVEITSKKFTNDFDVTPAIWC